MFCLPTQGVSAVLLLTIFLTADVGRTQADEQSDIQSCEDTFEVRNDTNALGAYRASGITTVDDCEAYCLSRTFELCAGFDFNTVDLGCWIHTIDTITNINENVWGVNLYTRQRCNSTCVDTFEERADTNAMGASEAPGITTQHGCKAECVSRIYEQCAGFDFNTVNPSCWIHTPATINNMNHRPGINLYIRQRCSNATCEDTFDEMTNRHARGGSQAPGITTRAGCVAECLSLTSVECAGFDYNTMNPSCWIHTNATIDNISYRYRINLYIRQPCTSTTADPGA